MQVTQIGAAFASTDPSAASGWFAEHLGFRVLVDLGWYASTRHPDRAELRVDFVRRDHTRRGWSRRTGFTVRCSRSSWTMSTATTSG